MHILSYPAEPSTICIYNLKTKVKSVYLLETGEQLTFRQLYEIARDEYRFRIYLPQKPENELDTIVVAEIEEPLEYHDLHTIYAKNEKKQEARL